MGSEMCIRDSPRALPLFPCRLKHHHIPLPRCFRVHLHLHRQRPMHPLLLQIGSFRYIQLSGFLPVHHNRQQCTIIGLQLNPLPHQIPPCQHFLLLFQYTSLQYILYLNPLNFLGRQLCFRLLQPHSLVSGVACQHQHLHPHHKRRHLINMGLTLLIFQWQHSNLMELIIVRWDVL